MTEIRKMDLESKDLVAERVEQLKALFPEVATEGDGSIDFEKLRLILGDDVDDGEERYAFTWPGKADAIRQAQLTSTATLRPCIEESSGADGTPGGFDSENLYIEGDNLEVLKLLQKGYHGAVKLIYIDPPYNTGHDFVYKDKFGDTIANYREQAGLAGQANADTSGTYHSNWCSMMYPRLKLARELLRDDGVIFISIDDNESSNLRKVCDEVFGADCFVADIAWQRTYSRRNDSLGIAREVEHVLAYAFHSLWQPYKLPRTEEMDSLYGSQDGDSRPWSSVTVNAPGAATHQGMVYAIQQPITGELIYPPIHRCWSFGQDVMFRYLNEWAEYELRTIDDIEKRAEICGSSNVPKEISAIMLSDDSPGCLSCAAERYQRGCEGKEPWPYLYFTGGGKGGIRRKQYLDESSGRIPSNLWPHSEVGHTGEASKDLSTLFNGSAPFDTPKPVRLMDRILTIATGSDSIVLDFFSGSASMGEAVMRKNLEDGGTRKYILVQLPEPAKGEFANLCEIGKERIRRAGRKIAAEVDESNRQLKLGEDPKQLPDIGFRVLKLDESGIAKPEPGQLIVDRVKPGRTDMDIIFEMMLKWGMDLTFPVRRIDCAGYPCYSVADDELICCLADGLTEEALRAMADLEPRRVFLLDRILTDTLKLNAELIFGEVGERTQVEVDIRTV